MSAAFVLLALDVLLASAWIIRSFQSTIVPYVVTVDRLGQVQAAGVPLLARDLQPALVHHQLAHFLRALRTVVPDATVQKSLLEEAYAYLQDQALITINQHLRENSPFARPHEGRATTVHVQSVLPLSDDTWQAQWIEDQRTSGSTRSVAYQALLSVTISPPTKTDVLLDNPLGIYITRISWTELRDAPADAGAGVPQKP